MAGWLRDCSCTRFCWWIAGCSLFPLLFLKGRAARKPLEVTGAVPLSMDKLLCVSQGKFHWRPCRWVAVCREPGLPTTWKPYLVWLIGGRKWERKALSLALPRKSTSLAPPGWLRLPTPRVEVTPLLTPPSSWLPSPWGLPAWPAPAKGGAQGTLAHHWSEKVSMPLKRRWIFCRATREALLYLLTQPAACSSPVRPASPAGL